jgi:hypothetical protein
MELKQKQILIAPGRPGHLAVRLGLGHNNPHHHDSLRATSHGHNNLKIVNEPSYHEGFSPVLQALFTVKCPSTASLSHALVPLLMNLGDNGQRSSCAQSCPYQRLRFRNRYVSYQIARMGKSVYTSEGVVPIQSVTIGPGIPFVVLDEFPTRAGFNFRFPATGS